MPDAYRSGSQSSPSALRNRGPIIAILRRVLPANAAVLEIASGTGEHAEHFASELPGVLWRPSEVDDHALSNIESRRLLAGLANLLPPMRLDTAQTAWPVEAVDAVVAINMIHIAPWIAAEGLIAGARRVLSSGGTLFLYGPFREGGRHTAASNAAFDENLKTRNPAWGVRDLEAVQALANRQGFDLAEKIAMPVNNLSLVFRRRAD